MELAVLVVPLVLMLLLPSVDTDSLECGRREGSTLCERTLVALVVRAVGVGELEAFDNARNAEGALGLEVLRRSFSACLSLIGDGESSMIRTHPEVSATGVRLKSESESMLRLLEQRSSAGFR